MVWSAAKPALLADTAICWATARMSDSVEIEVIPTW